MLASFIASIIKLLLAIRGYVFSKDSKHLGPVGCLGRLHRACEKAGMRRIGWHTLRHTFASHLAQNGVSIIVIKDLLGHADIKTTMRYSHLSSTIVRGAIETLNKDIGHNMATLLNGERKKLPLGISVTS